MDYKDKKIMPMGEGSLFNYIKQASADGLA